MAFRAHIAVWLLMLTLAGCRESAEPSRLGAPNFARDASSDETRTTPITTIDYWVPVVSSVPANVGQNVELFLRERRRNNTEAKKVVLMVHGRSVPVLAGFDLPRDRYDWALWLAQSGDLDVFMVDLQGSGRSPRPDRAIRHPTTNGSVDVLASPCNVPSNQQDLVPSDPTCTPYPFQLVTARSDWDELDAVVDYIRELRHVEKVALVGWSHASVRIGPYAVMHPEKVESLLLYAPFYDPTAPAGRAGTGDDGFGPPINPRTATPFTLPQPGTPMTLNTRAIWAEAWNREVHCDGQIEEGMQDIVWNTIMDNDAIGRTWGAPDEGVMRVRTFFLWGWNATTVGKITVPVLIIDGEFDTNVPATMDQLYGDLRSVPEAHKLLFMVRCAGHHLVWERQHKVLLHASKEWLRHGAVDGYTTGTFIVDTEGAIHRQ